ncbi:hypothetical protein ACFSYH_00325 [Populibacterium corticicola]|uniref:Uncharacterized protein n=1 Tax=Populibacterium corticicola TaxID=1812826 RepID=A0ABW5XD29_9MICO
MTINKLDARLEAQYWPNTHRRMASIGLLKALLVDGEPLWTRVAKETWGQWLIASWLGQYTNIQTPEELVVAQENSQGEFSLGLGGMSLAYGASPGYFPYDKIPLLTCFCGDELCSYVACTVTFEADYVTWSGFGWVGPDYETEDETIGWAFSPLHDTDLLRFDQSQYHQTLQHWLNQPTPELWDAEAARRAARNGLFGQGVVPRLRRRRFPDELRQRLTRALYEIDPVRLRELAYVDPTFYDNLEGDFWARGYRAYLKNPERTLTAALEYCFRLPVDRERIARVVRD